MITIGKLYILEQFIEIVKLKKDRNFNLNGERIYDNNYYCIYIEKNDDIILKKEKIIYVSDNPTADENDVETFPTEVIKMNFWIWLSDENFQTIIDLAYKQKQNASMSEYIQCLNYFDTNDDFLDLK